MKSETVPLNMLGIKCGAVDLLQESLQYLLTLWKKSLGAVQGVVCGNQGSVISCDVSDDSLCRELRWNNSKQLMSQHTAGCIRLS